RELRGYAYNSGAGLLVGVIVLGALYAAQQMREERTGLRLAGLLHPAADGLKTAFKEDFIPPNADRLLHSVAPLISFFPALVVLGTVPFADTLCFGEAEQDLRLGPLVLVRAHHLDPTKLLARVPRDGLCYDHAVSIQVAD